MPWWSHQMETFSALQAFCAGNSPVPGEFPAQRPLTRSFDVFFDLRLNKLLSKQSWGWWFEMPSHPLWRHRNALWLSPCGLVTPYYVKYLGQHWFKLCHLWSCTAVTWNNVYLLLFGPQQTNIKFKLKIIHWRTCIYIIWQMEATLFKPQTLWLLLYTIIDLLNQLCV